MSSLSATLCPYAILSMFCTTSYVKPMFYVISLPFLKAPCPGDIISLMKVVAFLAMILEKIFVTTLLKLMILKSLHRVGSPTLGIMQIRVLLIPLVYGSPLNNAIAAL